MALVSLGDLARNMMLQRTTLDAKRGLNALTAELASGHYRDVAARLNGDMAPLAGVEAILSRLSAWEQNAAGVATRLNATQSALGALDGLGQSLSDTLLKAGTSVETSFLEVAVKDAFEHLSSAMGLLNTRVGEQSVFAGTRVDYPAVQSADDLLDVVMPVLAGALNATEAMDRLKIWFADPAGFAVGSYMGGPRPASISVGAGETTSPGVTALDPAITDLLVGLTAAAAMDRGLFTGQSDTRLDLARQAGEHLFANASARATLAGSVGLSQARLSRAQARNSAEETALQIVRAEFIGKDPAKTATELENARTQLELLHILTARLSGLTLLSVLK